MRIIFVIFYKARAKFTDTFHKFSFLIHKGQNPEVMFLARFKVISPKCGGGMNYAGTLFCGNKITGDYFKRCRPGSLKSYLFNGVCFKRQKLFVCRTFHLCSFKLEDCFVGQLLLFYKIIKLIF